MKTAGLFFLLLLPRLQEKPVELRAGDPAPEFESTDDTGHPWKTEDHYRKRIIVLYFYPASFTGGCTEEAVQYQKNAEKLIDKGAAIVGISGDAVKTQAAFRKQYKLEFPLLSDPKGDVARLFGVPVSKGGKARESIEGEVKTFEREVTLDRWTFIIGRDGKIAYRNTKVLPDKDAASVLDVITKMQ